MVMLMEMQKDIQKELSMEVHLVNLMDFLMGYWMVKQKIDDGFLDGRLFGLNDGSADGMVLGVTDGDVHSNNLSHTIEL